MLTSRMRILATTVAAAVAFTSASFTPASARSRGDAAALAAIVGVFGTIAAIAAADAHRDHYRRYEGYRPYYGGPYAPPPPAYYGAYGYR
jgi:hypothetical protein